MFGCLVSHIQRAQGDIEVYEEVMSKFMHKRIFCQKGVKTAALLSRSTRHLSAANIFPTKFDVKFRHHIISIIYVTVSIPSLCQIY